MVNIRLSIKIILLLLCITCIVPAYADANTPAAPNEIIQNNDLNKENVVQKRIHREEEAIDNPFFVSFYKPTYVLPFYYTTSPYDSIYLHETPGEQSVKPSEVKFQFSFKVPVWTNILGRPSSLYFAYTQLSYWQLYLHSPFIRETDYEPEVFVSNQVHLPTIWGWQTNLINVGAEHQSNGAGGFMERSWNRIYVESVSSRGNWVVSIRPWYIIPGDSLRLHNSDIGKYMGYGHILVGYKFHRQVISLQIRNYFESGFHRGSTQLNWSFPLTTHFNGFVQLFSGYGQSLIEYNHYTNGVGVGISLSNWL
jgi:phospholipase A1